MTGAAFLTHIFLEETDTTMQKIATVILAKRPKDDIDALQAQVKQTGASLWYTLGTTGQPSRSGRRDGAIIVNIIPTTRNNFKGNTVFAIRHRIQIRIYS